MTSTHFYKENDMVWTTADVDLNDIDDDIMVRHLVSRGFEVQDKYSIDNPEYDSREQLMPIYEALHLGKKDEAFYLMSNYISDKLGRVV